MPNDNDNFSPINEIENMSLDEDQPAKDEKPQIKDASASEPAPTSNTPPPSPAATPEKTSVPPASGQNGTTKPIPPLEPTSQPSQQAKIGPSVPPVKNGLSQIDSAKNKAVIKKGGSPRWLKISALILVILLAGGFAYFWFFYQIVITIDPTSAPDQITLNGKTIGTGKHRLLPGNVSLQITKSGYSSYVLNRNINPGEKIDLNFSFVKETSSELVAAGATLATKSFDGKVVDFVSANGKIMLAVPQENEAARTSELSVGTFKKPTKFFPSNDNAFAVILDSEALKVVDFLKSDLINQLEAKLPPDPTLISDFTLNRSDSRYAEGVNSRIIYDLKTDYGWNLILADRNHKKSEIIMDLSDSNFSNLSLDWGNNADNVLLTGGELGKLNLANRSYEKISDKNNFVTASWGPKGTYGFAQDSAGEIFKIKGNQVESTGQKTKVGQVNWVDEKSIVFVDANKPVVFNFDTKAKIIYAEVSGLQNSDFVAVLGKKIFFVDSTGLKEAKLVENPYNEEGQK